VASAVYIFVGATILVLAFLERPVESLVAVATALAGIPVYLFFKRSAGKGACPGAPSRPASFD
jgi:APA family basic amino acid/polyamine antiporter